MCGICGFFHKKNVDKRVLIQMNDTILHRGPDDDGYFIENIKNNYQIGLAHKRLSIIDLSNSGHQPMKSEDENIIVVFNGEIYNFKTIKKELEKEGYFFKSNSDTEVIIYAYKKWGINCVEKFNGMFAIAIYDKLKEELYLIRDRIGIKPLYYFYNGQDIVFASELKPIMKYPYFKKDISLHALNMYLHHQYITEPYTIFKNTYKLMPGSYIKYKNGMIEEKKYWDIRERFYNRIIYKDKTEKDYINELESLLIDSVKLRMISDVPIGAFLSGGIDSSLIVALMQKLSFKPVKTFTIGFNEREYNEANYAKKVSEYLGTDHNEIYFPITKVKDFIQNIPEYYDEPFADSSQLPTMLVSELARKKVKVVLSGDGGDELFCGYGRYDTVLRLRKYKMLSYILKSLDIKRSIEKKLAYSSRKAIKLMNLSTDNNIINSDYLTAKIYLDGVVKENYVIEKKYYDILEISDNIQERYMLQDMITYLPDDILTKVDRASMAYSLEARIPLLDYRVVEKSFNIPHSLKYKNGNKKYILKMILSKYIPHDLIDRPKQGFAIPIYEWLRKDLKVYIEKYFHKEFVIKQDLFNYDKLELLKENFEKDNTNFFARFIWSIIVFQIWYEKYM